MPFFAASSLSTILGSVSMSSNSPSAVDRPRNDECQYLFRSKRGLAHSTVRKRNTGTAAASIVPLYARSAAITTVIDEVTEVRISIKDALLSDMPVFFIDLRQKEVASFFSMLPMLFSASSVFRVVSPCTASIYCAVSRE